MSGLGLEHNDQYVMDQGQAPFLIYAYLKLGKVIYPDLQFDFTIINKPKN